MDDGKSKAIDVREWKPVKFAMFELRRGRGAILRMIDDGRLRAVIYGGEIRRRFKIDPESIEIQKRSEQLQ